MVHRWNDDQPIYRQLMNEVIGWILSGELKDGDALPSIRKIASDFEVNPLTAAKAYQGLTDNGLVDKRRGIGLFIKPGARERLTQTEKEKFMNTEWPEILARIEQVGIDPKDLLKALIGAREK